MINGLYCSQILLFEREIVATQQQAGLQLTSLFDTFAVEVV